MARFSLKRPWTPEDDQVLAELRNAGRSIRVIAVRLKRTESAVTRRAGRLGLERGSEPPLSPDVESRPE
jgi:hypothetical protein